MKNSLDCRIVQDLLPSYVDGLTCEFTNQSVEDHLKECPECFQALQRMKADEIHGVVEKVEVDYLSKVRSKMKSWKTVSGVSVILLLLTLSAGVILYDRMVPKEFSEVFEVSQESLQSCKLTHLASEKSVTLEGEEFQVLLEQLVDAAYYYDGKVDKVLYGDTYFLELYDTNGKQQVFAQITDEYYTYLDGKTYDFRNNKDVIEIVESFFEK